jgi:hypothetical protein
MMTKSRHINTGTCPKCVEIFSRYAGAHAGLRSWFITLQAELPEVHISCAGRGKVEQEDAFKKGTSRAHYGQSAHNFNMAIDIFKLHLLGAEWPRAWFEFYIKPAVVAHNVDLTRTFDLEWYGAEGTKFFELPHIEVRGWRFQPNKAPVE